ncbi:hypothetical protein DAI22_03g345050 [Oryza sativa Japonica Group]|nr:hypothetical protein DAI22_03g345050 [Oryza sativa Japonica Group]
MLPRGGGRRSPGELGALPGWTPAGEPEASRRRRRRRRASRLAQTPCRARAGGHIGRAAGGAAARSRERQGYLGELPLRARFFLTVGRPSGTVSVWCVLRSVAGVRRWAFRRTPLVHRQTLCRRNA